MDEAPRASHELGTFTLAAAIIAALATAWGWALIQFVHLFVQPGLENIRDEVSRLTIT